jgi:hypothetical protein
VFVSNNNCNYQFKVATKGLTTLKSEIDYDNTAMGLPPVTFAAFLIAKSFWEIVGVSEK